MKTLPSRRVAAHIVSQWIRAQQHPEALLPEAHPERALIQELAFGTIRRLRTLDWLLNQCIKKAPDPETRAYLLIGAYQVFFSSHIPDHAAVSETVNAARDVLDRKRSGFLNAVLRSLCRQRETLQTALDLAPAGIRYSHPDLLVQRWQEAFGIETTERLMAWDNIPPQTTIYVNPEHPDASKIVAQLVAEGALAESRPVSWPANYYPLSRGHVVSSLPGYAEGAFFVQDPATDLAIRLLCPAPGETILDACAAPGGKAIRIAQRMKGEGRLIAIEPAKQRLAPLQENIGRMGLTNIGIVNGSATDQEALAHLAPREGFDRILLDTPCTNTGVLRRRVDARWRFTGQTLRNAVGLQRDLLGAVARFLRPGGRLVYSTCSLEPEENQMQIQAFLLSHRDFTRVDEGMVHPVDQECDGAYACALRRNT